MDKFDNHNNSTHMNTRSNKNYSNDIVNEDLEHTSKKESNVPMRQHSEVTPEKI